MRNPGVILAIAMLFHASAAWAQGTGMPNLTFDGFGTLGVVHSDEDQADFSSGPFSYDGAGHTSDWSADVDSRLGLQLTADLAPRLSGVLQVVTEQRYDGTYDPFVELANLSFDLTPELSVRVGRLVLPTSMISEYRKVGYASHWVRPPPEVYRFVPITSFDGIDLRYQSRVDGFTNTLQLTYGQRNAKIDDFGELQARNGVAVTDTLEWGSTTLFAAYTHFRLTVEDSEYQQLFDYYRQFGPEGEAIADKYDIDGKNFDVINVGARYDPGGWFIMGELARMESRTFIGKSHGWYVSGGYRFGAVTPYVTIARVQVDSNTSDPGLPSPFPAELNKELNKLLRQMPEQKSISIGARWDVARNFALKVQYDHLDLDDGSRGVLNNVQTDFRPGGTVSLFSVALDFVF